MSFGKSGLLCSTGIAENFWMPILSFEARFGNGLFFSPLIGAVGSLGFWVPCVFFASA